MEITTNLTAPAVALSICAHPDDTEFGAGGTLAKWAALGTRICHVVCTDGSKGSWNPHASITDLVAARAREQLAAQMALGGSGEDVWFLRGVDGELENTPALRRELVRLIRSIQPDVILGHDPWKRYRLHPDHRAAGFLTLDAVVAARDPHFFAELRTPPHRAHTLLLFEADEPDHVEDISTTLDTKVTALLAHESQLESTMSIRPDSRDADTVRFADSVRRSAQVAAALNEAVEFGESFKRMQID